MLTSPIKYEKLRVFTNHGEDSCPEEPRAEEPRPKRKRWRSPARLAFLRKRSEEHVARVRARLNAAALEKKAT